MSTAPRRRPSQELSRARFRTLFFAALFLSVAALRVPPAGLAAAAGFALGCWSVSVARTRGRSLSHSFVACDWLLLGLCLALTGGVRSPLLAAVPFLVLAQLLPSAKNEWPYLVAPSLLAAIVLGIADPSLAGHKVLGMAAFAALVAVGAAVALRLRRAPRRSRSATAPSVDARTGFYTAARLRHLLPAELDAAEAAHQPLSLVCVRLDHFQDLRDFRGEEGSEAVVQAVARRLKRLCDADDLAFRLGPEMLAFTLRGQGIRPAKKWAEAARHDVAGQLIDRHRQTISTGVASYPPVHDARELLDEALEAVARPAAPVAHAELVVADLQLVAAR